ncbi:MAG TPA: sugar ABC transporter permease [Tissierellaceae bacterium]
MKLKKSVKKVLEYIVFAGPTTIAFLSVTVASFIYGIYFSFTNWNGISGNSMFVGFKNYFSAFSDKIFWNSFSLTLRFVFFTVIFTNFIAFALAFVLSKGMKGTNFFRAAFFSPNLVGGIILGLIWKFVFNEGLVSFGEKLNIPFLTSSILSTPEKAFWALVIVFVWQMSGYMMVIYIAGMMNIPKELIESGEIDGAQGFAKLKNIILPMVMPSITVCVFLTIQRAFMAYDLNLALTQGGPFNATEMVTLRIYNKAFVSEHYAVAQAEAFLFFLIIAFVTMVQIYFSKKAEVEL